MNLRLKLLLFLIPLVVLPLLVLGALTFVEQRDAAKEFEFYEMQESVDAIKDKFDTLTTTAKANITLFAENGLIKKYVLTDSEQTRYRLMHGPLLRLLKSYQDAYPDYYEIRILMPDGYEDARQVNIPLENLTEDEGDTPYFSEIVKAGDTVFSTVFRNPDNQEISMLIAKPLVLKDDAVDHIIASPKLRAYLVITIKLDDILNEINQDVIGKTGYLLAVNEVGDPLLNKDVAFRTVDLPVNALLTKGDQPVSDDPILIMQGNDLLYAYGQSLSEKLSLFAILPERDLYESAYKIGFTVLSLTVLIFVVLMGLLFFTVDRLVLKPIQQLGQVSREIGEGNLEPVIAVSSNDELGELASSFREMAAQLKRSNESVSYLAYHDGLTGLPNRAMFKKTLERAIADAEREKEQFALLFLDIDDFKVVNDTLGHEYGDELLRLISESLAHSVRGTDYISRGEEQMKDDLGVLARLGGDEFMVLLPDLKDIHTAEVVSERIIQALSLPFSVYGHDCYVGVSIGITIYPVDSTDVDELIKHADMAMYKAKQEGKNNFQYFSASMNVAARERLRMEDKLRKAVEGLQLEVYYQPQVAAATGKITGLEALCRWNDPEEGWISPNIFIPIAEEMGLIVQIGEWVLNKACKQAVHWQEQGYSCVPVSVNVSAVQFLRQDVAALIRNALKESGLESRYLEIEITESVLMKYPERAIEQLTQIKEMGVGIAMDDFGTGYSSLSYLSRFPIDTLKIDNSFVQRIDQRKKDKEIVGAIIAMARLLHLRTVVEGIETESQYRVVSELDCGNIQGFWFFRPASADDICALIQEKKNIHLTTV